MPEVRRGRKLPSPEKIPTLLGRALLAIIASRGSTMREVADAAGIDHTSLVYALRGTRGSPALLSKLLSVLDARPERTALLAAHAFDEAARLGQSFPDSLGVRQPSASKDKWTDREHRELCALLATSNLHVTRRDDWVTIYRNSPQHGAKTREDMLS